MRVSCFLHLFLLFRVFPAQDTAISRSYADAQGHRHVFYEWPEAGCCNAGYSEEYIDSVLIRKIVRERTGNIQYAALFGKPARSPLLQIQQLEHNHYAVTDSSGNTWHLNVDSNIINVGFKNCIAYSLQRFMKTDFHIVRMAASEILAGLPAEIRPWNARFLMNICRGLLVKAGTPEEIQNNLRKFHFPRRRMNAYVYCGLENDAEAVKMLNGSFCETELLDTVNNVIYIFDDEGRMKEQHYLDKRGEPLTGFFYNSKGGIRAVVRGHIMEFYDSGGEITFKKTGKKLIAYNHDTSVKWKMNTNRAATLPDEKMVEPDNFYSENFVKEIQPFE